ncbi:hypothetical protein L596_002538 [Steinernema carpocapsae]|uniref:Cyclopropane-fatty-acyl-phospholipid synthase n=1 Tax=Steinernema carpocapsae TaxID=34508 RepID=A0A4V6I7R0_STECR|nr:hypothetical protein L596_002538 [Steinernema carpocapsae]
MCILLRYSQLFQVGAEEFERMPASHDHLYWRYGRRKKNEKEVELLVHNPIKFCFRMLMDPKLGLGESFMAGDWDARPFPKDLLTLLIRSRNQNLRTSKPKRGFNFQRLILGQLTRVIRAIVWFFNYLQHKIRENTLTGSQQNIRDHYDLGNDMFNVFLDKSMTYSCGVFEEVENVCLENSELLYEAQMRKYDRIIELLDLKPTDKVLEIGCGWGALSVRAVKKIGCQWTGLTLSREQLEYAQELVQKECLEDKIDLKYCDYRLESGHYDKVVAVEMIEAVGHEYLPTFFQTINDRLKPNGIACIQVRSNQTGYKTCLQTSEPKCTQLLSRVSSAQTSITKSTATRTIS